MNVSILALYLFAEPIRQAEVDDFGLYQVVYLVIRVWLILRSPLPRCERWGIRTKFAARGSSRGVQGRGDRCPIPQDGFALLHPPFPNDTRWPIRGSTPFPIRGQKIAFGVVVELNFSFNLLPNLRNTSRTARRGFFSPVIVIVWHWDSGLELATRIEKACEP